MDINNETSDLERFDDEIIPLNNRSQLNISFEELEQRLELGCWINVGCGDACGCDGACGVHYGCQMAEPTE